MAVTLIFIRVETVAVHDWCLVHRQQSHDKKKCVKTQQSWVSKALNEKDRITLLSCFIEGQSVAPTTAPPPLTHIACTGSLERCSVTEHEIPTSQPSGGCEVEISLQKPESHVAGGRSPREQLTRDIDRGKSLMFGQEGIIPPDSLSLVA